MAGTIDALKIGKWRTGLDRKNRLVMLICEFTNRPPLVLAIPPDEASKIGRALCDFDQDGVPTPLRLS